jgi:hypothetical protein
LIQWAQKTIADLEQGRFAADPGRVRIHRLSRTEYNCTIRDLLGVDTHPADTFPTEGGGGGGFDNNADTLFVAPILMERYLAAATSVLSQAPKEKIFLIKKSWLTSERSVARNIIEHFGMRRTNRHFWETSDWFNAQALREQPERAGILDLNRYQNR